MFCVLIGRTAFACAKAEFLAAIARNGAGINVRCPNELKQNIEEAASALGQAVNEFAVPAVVHEARRIFHGAWMIRLF